MQAASSIPQQSSVYQIVTEQIIKQLEAGVAPWHRPWATRIPQNLVSKRQYRGINVFLLASRGYGSPYWLTYKQATEQGGNVRRSEHGSKVVFWKIDKYDSEDADGQTVAKTSAILRYYTVFNVEQCDGIKAPGSNKVNNPIEECERIVAGMLNPPATVQDARAWYRPANDTVGMPSRQAFGSAEEYYSTLFHELTHSTGHTSRVGREGIEKLNIWHGRRDRGLFRARVALRRRKRQLPGPNPARQRNAKQRPRLPDAARSGVDVRVTVRLLGHWLRPMA